MGLYNLINTIFLLGKDTTQLTKCIFIKQIQYNNYAMKCQPKSLSDTMIFLLGNLCFKKKVYFPSFKDIFLSLCCFFALFMVELFGLLQISEI